MLTQSNYNVTTQITHVLRTKVQMATPLFGGRSWLFAHVFYESLPSRWRMFFCLIFFHRNFPELLRPIKYPKNYNNKKYLAKKNTHAQKRVGNGFAGIRRTPAPNTKYQGLSPKNGVDIGCSTILGRYAWISLYEGWRTLTSLLNPR